MDIIMNKQNEDELKRFYKNTKNPEMARGIMNIIETTVNKSLTSCIQSICYFEKENIDELFGVFKYNKNAMEFKRLLVNEININILINLMENLLDEKTINEFMIRVKKIKDKQNNKE